MKQDLKSLKLKWYQKLANKGFRDIEYWDTNELKWADGSRYQARLFPEQYEEQARFYQLASQLLHSNKWWRKAGDKRIWQLFCEGLTIREIAKKIKRSPDYSWQRVSYYKKFIVR